MLDTDLVRAHVPDIIGTCRGSHKRHARVGQSGQFSGARGGFHRAKLVGKIRRQWELHQQLDVKKGFEPGLVGAGRKIRVAGLDCPPFSEGDQGMEKGRGTLPEELGVEGNEVEDW